jgi:hypothetical protein
MKSPHSLSKKIYPDEHITFDLELVKAAFESTSGFKQGGNISQAVLIFLFIIQSVLEPLG